MFNARLRHILVTTFVAILLTTLSFAFTSMDASSAPAEQQVSAAEVQGAIAPREKLWLALKPSFPGADIRLVIQWDRYDALNSGLGFLVLNEHDLQQVSNGKNVKELGLASGNVIFNQPTTMLDAAFGSVGNAQYTIVVYNDSTAGASFTLTAENGVITDDSGEQVTDPNAAAVEEEAGEDASTADSEADTGTEADTDTEAEASTTTSVVVDDTPVPTATDIPEPTATPKPAAAEPETEASDVEEEDATVTTIIDQSGVVRSLELKGDLAEQNSQHFLGLEPTNRDGLLELTMTFDPQDSSELSRRMNFWVVNEDGFKQFLSGTEFSQVALAAGNKVFRGPANMRKARFNATGTGLYTVIVYNNSRVPGSYTLRIDGGILIDETGQTKPTKAAATDSEVAEEAEETTATEDKTVAETEESTTAPATTETAAPATTAPETTAPETTTAAPAATGTRLGEPGGSYVVQSGDTLALVALDIYGNLNAWEAICEFNGLGNCNVIEIGDQLKLPTLEQIASLGSGIPVTAPAAETAAPAAAAAVEAEPADEAAATDEAATEESTTEAAAEESADAAASDAPEIAVTETVSDTETTEDAPAVSDTAEITGTDTITETGE